jgi:hypothetical protein
MAGKGRLSALYQANSKNQNRPKGAISRFMAVQ